MRKLVLGLVAGLSMFAGCGVSVTLAQPSTAAGGGPKPDDAYRAFVKMYNDSSTIKAEYTVCMPKM